MSVRKLADRRQRRIRRATFWGLAAALVFYGAFIGDHRPHHLALLWLEERRTEERIAELEVRREELDARLGRVESDSIALEALAREKGLVRPGELVYRIVPVPSDVREAAAESLAAEAARAPAVQPEAPPPAEPVPARPPRETARDPGATTDPRWQWLDDPAPVPSGTPARAGDSLTAG